MISKTDGTNFIEERESLALNHRQEPQDTYYPSLWSLVNQGGPAKNKSAVCLMRHLRKISMLYTSPPSLQFCALLSAEESRCSKLTRCDGNAVEGYTADYVPVAYPSLTTAYDADLIEGDDTRHIGSRDAVDCALYAGKGYSGEGNRDFFANASNLTSLKDRREKEIRSNEDKTPQVFRGTSWSAVTEGKIKP